MQKSYSPEARLVLAFFGVCAGSEVPAHLRAAYPEFFA